MKINAQQRTAKTTIVLFLIVFFAGQLSGQQISLTILHWNDFHAQNLPYTVKSKSKNTGADTAYQVGGSAVLKAYIEKFKKESDATLVCNSGDDFQGSPISTITKGSSQIQLMNLIAPDVITIGNHEFDYGRESLERQLAAARFPIVSANLVDKLTHKPVFPPYYLITIKGMVVGVIGLMTPELEDVSLPANLPNLYVAPLSSTVKELLPELRKKHVGLIVVLSHSGVEADSILAFSVPAVNVILGGHSHTAIFTPKKVNGVIICQAGSNGRYLGKLDLVIDVQRDSVTSFHGELIETRVSEVTPDTMIATKVQELEFMVDKAMKEVIGKLAVDWKRNFRGESNIGNWVTDAMRRYAKTDIAFQNSGGIRKDMLAGPITIRDIWEICPFGNTLIKFRIDGTTLSSMIQFQSTRKQDFGHFSGISYTYTGGDSGAKIESTLVNGQKIDSARLYTIVTNNFVAEQSLKHFGFQLLPSQITPLNVLDRDVLIEAIRNEKIIRSMVEGRIQEIHK